MRASTLSCCGSPESWRRPAPTASCCVAGGGATNAVCLHARARRRARRPRVRVRDPGHGRRGCAHERGCVRIGLGGDPGASARRHRRGLRLADRGRSSGSRTGTPTCGRVRSWRGSSIGCDPRPVAEIKAEIGDLVARRKATQPTTKRTFGSVWKNPPGDLGAGRMLELCGLKGHRVGGAVVSPMHANFIENAGGATTADCLALMGESRRRAREQFGVELEHEVVLLGDDRGRLSHGWVAGASYGLNVRLTTERRVGRSRGAANTVSWPPGSEQAGVGVRARARRASSSRSRAGTRAAVSTWRGSLLRRRSLLLAFALLAGAALAYVAARETSMFAVRTVSVEGAITGAREAGASGRSPRPRARACSPSTWRPPRAPSKRCLPSRPRPSTAPFRTRSPSASCPSARSR